MSHEHATQTLAQMDVSPLLDGDAQHRAGHALRPLQLLQAMTASKHNGTALTCILRQLARAAELQPGVPQWTPRLGGGLTIGLKLDGGLLTMQLVRAHHPPSPVQWATLPPPLPAAAGPARAPAGRAARAGPSACTASSAGSTPGASAASTRSRAPSTPDACSTPRRATTALIPNASDITKRANSAPTAAISSPTTQQAAAALAPARSTARRARAAPRTKPGARAWAPGESKQHDRSLTLRLRRRRPGRRRRGDRHLSDHALVAMQPRRGAAARALALVRAHPQPLAIG